VINAPSSLELF
jgi:hypothetical protein